MKAGGNGLEFGEVGVPAEFNIWTREAGEGKIAISIEGPSKAEINFKDRKDGSCNVAYTVKEPGEYHVSLKVRVITENWFALRVWHFMFCLFLSVA